MNIDKVLSKIEAKRKERELDVVVPDNARARRRFAERDRRNGLARVHGRRQRAATQAKRDEHVAYGQSNVLANPERFDGPMRQNVLRSVTARVEADERASLLVEGKPRVGTREFDRVLRRNVKAALAEAGL